jgi:hypothetical protein
LPFAVIGDSERFGLMAKLFQQRKETGFPNSKGMPNFLSAQMPLLIGGEQNFDLVSCELFVKLCHDDPFSIITQHRSSSLFKFG